MDPTRDPSILAKLSHRRISGVFWHQGSTRHSLASFADPAISDGRYHRRGGPGVWYASDQEQAAWAELFRHFLEVGVDPFEVRRLTGKVTVTDLEVLDLTDSDVRDYLGVELADLEGDDYATTQHLAASAAAAGFGGVLAASAALPGRKTLVVFPAGMPQVKPGRSRISQPPPRLADLLHTIRPHPDVPSAVRDTLRLLAQAGGEAVRRLRRSR